MQTRISQTAVIGGVLLILVTSCFPTAWMIACLAGANEKSGWWVFYVPVLLVFLPLLALKESTLLSLRNGNGTLMSRLGVRLDFLLVSLIAGGFMGVISFFAFGSFGSLSLMGSSSWPQQHVFLGLGGLVLGWGAVLIIDFYRLIFAVVDLVRCRRRDHELPPMRERGRA